MSHENTFLGRLRGFSTQQASTPAGHHARVWSTGTGVAAGLGFGFDEGEPPPSLRVPTQRRCASLTLSLRRCLSQASPRFTMAVTTVLEAEESSRSLVVAMAQKQIDEHALLVPSLVLKQVRRGGRR